MVVDLEQGRKATTATDPNIHASFVYKLETSLKKCKASHKGTSHVSWVASSLRWELLDILLH